ncbi:caspase family protein [Gemmata obscuriglobus]|uniref:caspase family protein n=1 Tax=Gemmata obscuriglobus TaxID=114 RepID=UPI00016C4B00|nr:caspase family protein [Gemmata obscuriglobus]
MSAAAVTLDEKTRNEFVPRARAMDVGKRALLVGVTKYDHLAPASHLSGPGNDIRLMRTTLIERYGFPAENVVCLTEDEGKSELRPTRSSIAREFKRLAEAARPGDQVVVLLAGHGDRQPESDPPDPVAPESDGIDEIFLPADVRPWKDRKERVPNAIADKEIRDWLAAITAKKAYVWAVFDCCHAASMNREGEVVRQLPGGVLVPPAELAKARGRAAMRTGRPAPEQRAKGSSLTPGMANELLVATFACREYETTPECLQPTDSPGAKYHGLLTYSLVRELEQSAASGAPLTYRELTRRVQAGYLARPQGAPSPSTEGAGQDRVVLGTNKPARPTLTLARVRGEHVVNVGDLHGITPGSVLRVYSPPGEKERPRAVGYARVTETRPLESVVSATEYDKTAKPVELPMHGLCEVTAVDYSVGRLRLAVPADQRERDKVIRCIGDALRTLPKADTGVFELVADEASAQFLVRASAGEARLVGVSGRVLPVLLPALDAEQFGAALVAKLKTIHRARALVDVGVRLEAERGRGALGAEVKIEVLVHRTKNDPGQVLERPKGGWAFRPGDRISFRVTNTSSTKRLEVTLLIVDPEYRVTLFHPARNELNKALEPGASFTTVVGGISNEPPFGPETLVAIVTAPTNPPVDFGLLTQPGGQQRGYAAQAPIAQLLERAMYGTGLRSGLTVSEIAEQGARVLTWRTEPKE